MNTCAHDTFEKKLEIFERIPRHIHDQDAVPPDGDSIFGGPMRCCNTFFDAFVTEITFVDTCVTETMTFCQMGGCELSLGRVRTAGIYCTAFADISLILGPELVHLQKKFREQDAVRSDWSSPVP